MSAEDLEQVNMHEAKTHLSKLVERAEGGEEIVISRAGKPAAKLVPATRDSSTAWDDTSIATAASPRRRWSASARRSRRAKEVMRRPYSARLTSRAPEGGGSSRQN